MLKEHLNELKSRKRAQLRLPLFPWGWDIETEAGEVQRVTSATSLPDTPPYRTLIRCSHCPRLPPQRRHLEGA
jgi:hypothetical protein